MKNEHSWQNATSIHLSKDMELLLTSSKLLKQEKIEEPWQLIKQKLSYVNLYSILHEYSKDWKPFEVVAESPVFNVLTCASVDLGVDSLDEP